jgi:hypothetical protein
MAKKMWVWKDPDPKTGEKGVLMQLRIYSYMKWKTKIVHNMANVKRHYNLLLGEHLEITNPSYASKIADNYQRYLRDFDLWFHATDQSHDFVYKRTGMQSASIPNMRMSACCYLINQSFWTPDFKVQKDFDFMMCLNDLVSYKRPEWAMRLWTQWCRLVPDHKRFVVLFSNEFRGVLDSCKSIVNAAGFGDSVDFVRSPRPESILDAYRRSRFMLHPSKTESGPRVIAEAMSCGIPCVIPSENWKFSVSHLLPGIQVLSKGQFNSSDGVQSLLDFEKKVKPEELPGLVNTRGYLNQIDQKLAQINRVWTLGKLMPPQFVGGHIQDDQRDALFSRITGEALI